MASCLVFHPDTDFGNVPALRGILVIAIKRTQREVNECPISSGRKCLIKFILMRVPIENGLGFHQPGYQILLSSLPLIGTAFVIIRVKELF
jgi:hypothetical protein